MLKPQVLAATLLCIALAECGICWYCHCQGLSLGRDAKLHHVAVAALQKQCVSNRL